MYINESIANISSNMKELANGDDESQKTAKDIRSNWPVAFSLIEADRYHYVADLTSEGEWAISTILDITAQSLGTLKVRKDAEAKKSAEKTIMERIDFIAEQTVKSDGPVRSWPILADHLQISQALDNKKKYYTYYLAGYIDHTNSL
jgi:hypothetical protein